MAKPQQPELHRSGLTPADPGSAKVHQQVEEVTPGGAGPRGPVPEANRPGHHPDVEQDKPVERFAAKARELAEEAHAAEATGDDAPPIGESAAEVPAGSEAAIEDVPVQPEVEPEARHTGEEDLAQPSPGDGVGPQHQNPLIAPAAAAWDMVRKPLAPLVARPPLVALPPLAAWDALRQPGMAWMEIDESRTGWLARIAFIPFVGAWRYATGVRPRLEGASVALRLRGG